MKRRKKEKREISLSHAFFESLRVPPDARRISVICVGEFRHRRIDGTRSVSSYRARLRIGLSFCSTRNTSSSLPFQFLTFQFRRRGVERTALSRVARIASEKLSVPFFSALRQFGLSSSLTLHCARSRHVRLRTDADSPDSLVSTIYSGRTAAIRSNSAPR